MLENVREAFHCAQLERAPVVLGIPDDLQRQLIEDASEYKPSATLLPASDGMRFSPRLVEEAVARIRGAERPIIVAGRGAVAADAKTALEALAAHCGALLSTTLPTKSLFDDNEFSVGIAGGFSSELAYEAFNQSDLLIAFGASLTNHTAHGGKLYPKAFVLQIDLAPVGLAYGAVTRPISRSADAKEGAPAILDRLQSEGGSKPGFRSAALARGIATEKLDPREYPIDPGGKSAGRMSKIRSRSSLRQEIPSAARLVRQNRLNGGPLIVSEFVAHDSATSVSGLNHGWAVRLTCLVRRRIGRYAP